MWVLCITEVVLQALPSGNDRLKVRLEGFRETTLDGMRVA